MLVVKSENIKNSTKVILIALVYYGFVFTSENLFQH
jgi:hypothetical protein